MSDTFTLSLGFTEMVCCNKGCLQPFALTIAFKSARVKDKRTFWCPNRHPQSFTGESAEERLRKNVEALQTRIGFRDAEISQLRNSRARVERRLRATKGVVTRMKRRRA
jgi:hypothetical protein